MKNTGLYSLIMILFLRSDLEAAEQPTFKTSIQPLVRKYCQRCHNVNKMTSGIRVDQLDGSLEDRHLFLWKDILTQVEDEAMPPEGEIQPTAQERKLLVDWIKQALITARSRNMAKNGSVRRMTVAQYRNTLRDLLGLEDDVTDILPSDGVSKDGFLNNGQTMELSPLLIEAYFEIAENAVDRCIVDESSMPMIQNFRMGLGAGINPKPFPEQLILGALNHLLPNQDFMVTQLTAQKPFEFDPFFMRTKYRFNEGYQGNSTVRGWRDYDSIYHSVFACVRGKPGYPKGLAYQTVPEGLLLRPSVPSAELFQVESTYGPQANFKVSLRELPDHGRFRVTVKAAKYADGLLLDPGTESAPDAAAEDSLTVRDLASPQTLQVAEAGIYQVDVHQAAPSEEAVPPAKPKTLHLQIGESYFAGILQQPAFLAVRLPPGPVSVVAKYGGAAIPHRVVFSRVDESSELGAKFATFEKRLPRLGVHVGLRRDCGSTLTQVAEVQTVSDTNLASYVFEGAINNFPSPDVQDDNDNYLAGVREIGIRSEYTDGRDMPRLLIRSVEFEGPYYETWPPDTHRRIFVESKHKDDKPAYAREVIRNFATRAFRRPVSDDEAASLFAVFDRSFSETNEFTQSVKDALLVTLTSPQFLFLTEYSVTPEGELLDGPELASKLSYFLWNAAPDSRLRSLASTGKLHETIDAEVERMILDPQFEQFTREFVSQWLQLDKFEVVEIDRIRYPKLTRDTRKQLRNEPVQLVQYLMRENLPLRDLVQADFIVANEVVASYYDLGDRTEHGFDFVAIPHNRKNLGGILTNAGILAGLSDGRESNPVKRGAWLARKIIAEPPDDPPPNVPALPEENSNLTLRQKLEQHRNQEGCAKCHKGIDPWGIPFEQFDAGGLFKQAESVDASSTLPDETKIADLNALKTYLAEDRIDQVAFSFLKHLTSYAIGRSLTYNEIEFLKEHGVALRSDGYRMQDIIRFVVNSEMFLEK